ncbi:hypothetical protein SAMN05421736_12015 [Evansella caseinilytica]|uniref:Uncharacterized protein n=1 Tax=Evansella caseinilytica TaxID=1503961 RepID=A0A1H3UDQ7_9BACI|nr:hypothetical protein [Evansella caseinilytica]SDZ59779.1 hypothetical protein SAMN05421736_12015 [Evansella caseinilytica]
MDELILEGKRAYHREYMRNYRKQNPEKIKEWRNNWYLKKALETKKNDGKQLGTAKEKAIIELEKLKNRQLEIEVKDVMKQQQLTAPTFF